jgi:ApaG protein
MTFPNQKLDMPYKISEGVKITVENAYQPEYSDPAQQEYLFAYKITIENNNSFPVQLLRRYWFIADSTGENREVEGEGVVGVQPVINPGKSYQYISTCNLQSELGKMKGMYLLENLHNKKTFEVIIPEFQLQVPFKLN